VESEIYLQVWVLFLRCDFGVAPAWLKPSRVYLLPLVW
jgi:hypothetical protein